MILLQHIFNIRANSTSELGFAVMIIPTLLDGYGATNPAEFFAVATEAFFERPRALRQQHPRLFAQFQSYFRQNPESFSSETEGASRAGRP